MAKIYSITKWRKNSKGTGAIVQLTHFDPDTEEFTNVKANVQFASNYAGGENDRVPASLAKIDKNGDLWIRCTRRDDYNPDTVYADRNRNRANEEQCDGIAAKEKKAAPKRGRMEAMDDDVDTPF